MARGCVPLLQFSLFEDTLKCPMCHRNLDPSVPGTDSLDSCCHEIGMSLIDECTVLDKPHGWIESELLRVFRGKCVHRSTTVVKLCSCLRQGSAKSRLLRPSAGARNPEFLRPTVRVVKLPPHVMNLVVETDNLVDGQLQRKL